MLSQGKWQGESINAYDMIKGFRQLIKLFGIDLSLEPTSEDFQRLFDLVEHGKILEHCSPKVAAALTLDGSAVPDQLVPDLLYSTGILRRIRLRTIRAEHRALRPAGSVVAIQPGGNAYDMEKRITLMNDKDLDLAIVFALASKTRWCSSEAELNHPAVLDFKARKGRVPIEWELQIDLLQQAGFNMFRSIHVANDIGGNVYEFTTQPAMRNASIVVYTSAPDLLLVLLTRRIMRRYWRGGFDAKHDQYWFCQESSQLATSPRQLASPNRFVRPLDMIPALVGLAYELYLLNGGKPIKAGA